MKADSDSGSSPGSPLTKHRTLCSSLPFSQRPRSLRAEPQLSCRAITSARSLVPLAEPPRAAGGPRHGRSVPAGSRPPPACPLDLTLPQRPLPVSPPDGREQGGPEQAWPRPWRLLQKGHRLSADRGQLWPPPERAESEGLGSALPGPKLSGSPMRSLWVWLIPWLCPVLQRAQR